MCLSKRIPLTLGPKPVWLLAAGLSASLKAVLLLKPEATATRPLLDNMVARFDRDMIPCEDGPDEVRK